jgi:hypothetical protein
MTKWGRSSTYATGCRLEVRDPGGDLGVIQLGRVAEGMVWDWMAVERAEWDAFVAGIKAGEFDDLLAGDQP